MIEAKNLNYSVGKKSILNNIDFKVARGEYISIIGESGSGKSTFLKILASLIDKIDGELYYKKKNYIEYNPINLRQEIGYCTQNSKLFGETVYDNLEFPFKTRNLKIDIERIYEIMDKFQFSRNFLYEDIRNLSGGEKQRVNIMRSLIVAPKILLLDECTSALDVKNKSLVQEIIQDFNKNDKITVLWITHDLEESMKGFHKRITFKEGHLEKVELLKEANING